MTFTQAGPTGSSHLGPLHRPQAGPGRFMVTLCTLAAPVRIRPPRSPQLRPFTFFTSQVLQPDGSERVYLHMGYFDTLAEAEKRAEAVRRSYPGAFATVAPGARAAAPQGRDPVRAEAEALTDSQVLRILEVRRVPAARLDEDDGGLDPVALVPPEDTMTRQALRDAVVEDAPVWFAVQLHWSSQPIELARVRPLSAFRPYTLYAIQSRRSGALRSFLRLGFFSDPASARQVAAEVRSSYAASVVIPVLDAEVARAREQARGAAAIPCLAPLPEEVQVAIQDDTLDTHPLPMPVRSTPKPQSPPRLEMDRAAGRKARAAPERRQVEDALDTLSESGVRHVRVEVQEEHSGRWKIIQLSDAPPDEAPFFG